MQVLTDALIKKITGHLPSIDELVSFSVHESIWLSLNSIPKSIDIGEESGNLFVPVGTDLQTQASFISHIKDREIIERVIRDGDELHAKNVKAAKSLSVYQRLYQDRKMQKAAYLFLEYAYGLPGFLFDGRKRYPRIESAKLRFFSGLSIILVYYMKYGFLKKSLKQTRNELVKADKALNEFAESLNALGDDVIRSLVTKGTVLNQLYLVSCEIANRHREIGDLREDESFHERMLIRRLMLEMLKVADLDKQTLVDIIQPILECVIPSVKNSRQKISRVIDSVMAELHGDDQISQNSYLCMLDIMGSSVK